METNDMAYLQGHADGLRMGQGMIPTTPEQVAEAEYHDQQHGIKMPPDAKARMDARHKSWLEGTFKSDPRDEQITLLAAEVKAQKQVLSGYVDEIQSLKQSLQRANEIVGKLPVTADGVPITPDMKLWCSLDGELVEVQVMTVGNGLVNAEEGNHSGFNFDMQPELFFSTHEAADSLQGQTRCCEIHVGKLRAVASAMGTHLQVISILDEHAATSSQESQGQ